MFYEIKFIYEGKEGYEMVKPDQGYEFQFFKKCINYIDYLTRAGAVITDTHLYEGNK